MKFDKKTMFALVTAMFVPGVAYAHPINGSRVVDGIIHLFSEPDHIFIMLVAGIIALQVARYIKKSKATKKSFSK